MAIFYDIQFWFVVLLVATIIGYMNIQSIEAKIILFLSSFIFIFLVNFIVKKYKKSKEVDDKC